MNTSDSGGSRPLPQQSRLENAWYEYAWYETRQLFKLYFVQRKKKNPKFYSDKTMY